MLFACFCFNTYLTFSKGLYLTESEIQSIVRNSELVDAKIEELTALVLQPVPLKDEVSILQTILLLEPYSNNAHCDLGIVYSRISELVMRVGVSTDALSFIHRGLRHEELCSGYNSKRVCGMIGKMGSFHLISENIDSSLYYFKKAALYTDTMSDPLWHASAMNNLGMAWSAAGFQDSVYIHYNSAIFNLNNSSLDHESLLGSITDNLALWHEKEGEHELARQRHSENVSRFTKLKDTLHTAQAWMGVTLTHWVLGSKKRALVGLDSAYSLMQSYTSEEPRRAEMFVKYYQLKSGLLRDDSNFRGSAEAADSALVWEQRHNELSQNALKLMLTVLNESDLARVRRERGLRKDLLQVKQQSHNRLLLLIGSLLILAVSLFYSFLRNK